MTGASRALALRVGGAHAVLCIALWPWPVVGLLHAESAAIVAGAGCLMAATWGWTGRMAVRQVAHAHLAALLVPAALLTLSMLWRPNCGYLQGLGLFLLFAPPSVLFGIGVGATIQSTGSRWPRMTGALAVVVAAGLGVLLDLRFHPQLFTYSHVFGGVVGPIYDEELAIRPGLFAAKAQTLLWAATLLGFAAWRRGGGASAMRAGVGALLALGISYLAAGPLGIVQTPRGIEAVLSERLDLGPVVLHLDPETSPPERRRLAEESLYRYESLAAALDVTLLEPIDIYLYPDPDVKAALIGSRTTSVVPVWLRTPQIHMLAEEVTRSLGHEMVHVLARDFGMPIVGASPAIGLVEGLAVALEPPDGAPAPAALVNASRARADEALDPARDVVATMSPTGFWTARSGIAYTVNGAFVRWLLDRDGLGPFKMAYRTGRFDQAYGADLATLAAEWSAQLRRQPVDPEAVAVAEWLFSRPSLFEKRCPHHVPPAVRRARDGLEARERGDVSAAADLYGRAVDLDPYRLGAVRGEISARLAGGGSVERRDVDRARRIADSLRTAESLLHLADVVRLRGEPADRAYQTAADSLAPIDAVGRSLIARRRALSRDALRELWAQPPDGVSLRLERQAPVLAALRHAAADRPDDAWRLARRWCQDSTAADPEAARVQRLLQAQIAGRAVALREQTLLLTGLADAFRLSGPRSYAPVVEDALMRAQWLRSRPLPPPIFADPTPALDDFVPCRLSRRPRAGDGVRTSRGGL